MIKADKDLNYVNFDNQTYYVSISKNTFKIELVGTKKEVELTKEFKNFDDFMSNKIDSKLIYELRKLEETVKKEIMLLNKDLKEIEKNKKYFLKLVKDKPEILL